MFILKALELPWRNKFLRCAPNISSSLGFSRRPLPLFIQHIRTQTNKNTEAMTFKETPTGNSATSATHTPPPQQTPDADFISLLARSTQLRAGTKALTPSHRKRKTANARNTALLRAHVDAGRYGPSIVEPKLPLLINT